MRSPYQILGVKRAATAAEIKSAYRAKSKRLHPDHGGDPAKFRELVDAYKLLMDPARRQEYDAPKPRAPRPRPSHQAGRPVTSQPPRTQTERERMIEQLRTVGIRLVFDALGDVVPPGPVRVNLENVFSDFLGEFLKPKGARR